MLRTSGVTPDHIRVFAHLCLGVDLSVFLHKSMHTDECANQYHATPSVPVSAVLHKAQELLALARKHDITLMWVVDGVSPPCKLDNEGADRQAAVDKALAALAEIVDNNQIAELDSAMSWRKKSVTLRSDMMHTVLEYLKIENQEVRQVKCRGITSTHLTAKCRGITPTHKPHRRLLHC